MTLLSRLLIVTGVSTVLTAFLMLVYWEPEAPAAPIPVPAIAPTPAADDPGDRPSVEPAPAELAPTVPTRQAKYLRDDEGVEWVMLMPHEVANLPADVQNVLSDRGCAIPVSRERPNIVWGELRKQGQTDLAVLCVRDERAAIYVFWNGDAAALEQSADTAFLPGLAARTATPNDLLAELDEEGAIDPGMPRVIRHDGIELTRGCCGEAHYWHRGRWRFLTTSY